jgi:glycosyltransferase involved in cell wall biosynthesis
MNSDRCSITVIVAVLNMAKTLRRCLDSIVNQTYPDRELIVMDGGSSDGSAEIVHSYQDHIAAWESVADRGIYHAWNKALKHARGEWICFLGADDCFWDNSVLEALAPSLNRAIDGRIRVVYGQMARTNSAGEILHLRGKPWESIRWQMAHGMPLDLPHPGLMHHRLLFSTHGPFDETFRIAGDYELLLRELKHKDRRALYVPEVRTVRNQVGGIADAINLLAHQETVRARRKNGLPAFSLIWLGVYIRALIRERWRGGPL